jgi:hypothetical protein
MSEMDDLRSELEAQKRRITELEVENAALAAAVQKTAPQAATPPRGRHPHRFWIALLLILGFLLTPLSFLAIFLKAEITDTGRYVQTVKPLSSNPAVQAYVADTVSQQLFAQVDVARYVREALPPRAEVLVGPLTSALQSFVRDVTQRILDTRQFQTLWVNANREAHTQLVNVVTGKKSGTVTATANGAVTVDLSRVAAQVKQQLEASGLSLFSKIPVDRVGGKITVFQSKDLYKVRQAVKVLDALAFVLPIVGVACFGGAIYLSSSRRRGFVEAAIAFTLGALTLALLLNVGRGVYLNAVTDQNVPYDAAAAVYDTIVAYLHTEVRAALTFSLIVLIAVFFAGPSRFAVWFRARVRDGANWLGAESDRVGWGWLSPQTFVVRHKARLHIAVAVVAFVVVFRWNHPTPVVILGLAALALLALAVIEFFGREAPAPAPAPAIGGPVSQDVASSTSAP